MQVHKLIEQLLPEEPLIGIQLRMGSGGGFKDDAPFTDPAMVPNIWQCAKSLTAFPNPVAPEFVTTALSANISARYFLSTDSTELVPEARKVFGDSLLTSDGTAEHSSATNSNAKTFVDFFVLCLCDNLFVTPGSSYGAVAALAAAVVPHYLGNTGEELGQCKLTNFTAPPGRRDFPAAVVFY